MPTQKAVYCRLPQSRRIIKQAIEIIKQAIGINIKMPL